MKRASFSLLVVVMALASAAMSQEKKKKKKKKGSREELVGGFAAGALPQTPGFSALAKSKIALDRMQVRPIV